MNKNHTAVTCNLLAMAAGGGVADSCTSVNGDLHSLSHYNVEIMSPTALKQKRKSGAEKAADRWLSKVIWSVVCFLVLGM